jgi:hypothetical protein
MIVVMGGSLVVLVLSVVILVVTVVLVPLIVPETVSTELTVGHAVFELLGVTVVDEVLDITMVDELLGVTMVDELLGVTVVGELLGVDAGVRLLGVPKLDGVFVTVLVASTTGEREVTVVVAVEIDGVEDFFAVAVVVPA